MTDVTPRFKVTVDCPCGCGLHGTTLKHTYKDGTNHVKGCGKQTRCKQCLGRKSRKTGLDAQRRAAKSLGVPSVGSMMPGNEEHYGGLVRMEAKSGAQVKSLFTAYLKAEVQSEASRPIGDTRPFIMSARLQPSSKDGLLVIRESQLQLAVYALALQLGLLDEGGA